MPLEHDIKPIQAAQLGPILAVIPGFLCNLMYTYIFFFFFYKMTQFFLLHFWEFIIKIVKKYTRENKNLSLFGQSIGYYPNKNLSEQQQLFRRFSSTLLFSSLSLSLFFSSVSSSTSSIERDRKSMAGAGIHPYHQQQWAPPPPPPPPMPLPLENPTTPRSSSDEVSRFSIFFFFFYSSSIDGKQENPRKPNPNQKSINSSSFAFSVSRFGPSSSLVCLRTWRSESSRTSFVGSPATRPLRSTTKENSPWASPSSPPPSSPSPPATLSRSSS